MSAFDSEHMQQDKPKFNGGTITPDRNQLAWYYANSDQITAADFQVLLRMEQVDKQLGESLSFGTPPWEADLKPGTNPYRWDVPAPGVNEYADQLYTQGLKTLREHGPASDISPAAVLGSLQLYAASLEMDDKGLQARGRNVSTITPYLNEHPESVRRAGLEPGVTELPVHLAYLQTSPVVCENGDPAKASQTPTAPVDSFGVTSKSKTSWRSTSMKDPYPDLQSSFGADVDHESVPSHDAISGIGAPAVGAGGFGIGDMGVGRSVGDDLSSGKAEYANTEKSARGVMTRKAGNAMRNAVRDSAPTSNRSVGLASNSMAKAVAQENKVSRPPSRTVPTRAIQPPARSSFPAGWGEPQSGTDPQSPELG